jgi:predicted lipoprotein with Yx(FWY)xxD motif
MKRLTTIVVGALIAAGYSLAIAQAAEQQKLQTSHKRPYGQYVTDAQGRPLYIFTADKKGTSHCRDACAQAWPPVTTSGKPEAGSGIEKNMLGTLQRKDGKTQITYNGHPLYYFSKDEATEAPAGQERHGFGGEWYLVSPSGTKVEAKG